MAPNYLSEYMKLSAYRPPLLALVVLMGAIAAGVYGHLRSPMGVFLSTPRDWCHGRSNAFAVCYMAVLGLAAALSALAAIVFVIARISIQRPEAHAKVTFLLIFSLKCLVFFVAALMLTPVFELELPLKPDPACLNQAQGAKP